MSLNGALMLIALLALAGLAAILLLTEPFVRWHVRYLKKQRMKEIKAKMIKAMQLYSIDVTDLKIEEIEGYYVPVARKLYNGIWQPILKWSYVSFDPTQGGFKVKIGS